MYLDGKRGHYPRLRLERLNTGEEYLFAAFLDGSGFRPEVGYLGITSGLLANAVNLRGETTTGPVGDDGWSPVTENVSDGVRRVKRVIDWVGGTGTKPPVNVYLGPIGTVVSIGDAVDLRGADAGTNDVFGPSEAVNNNLAKWSDLIGERITTHTEAGVSSLLTKTGYLTVTSQKVLADLVAAAAVNTAKVTTATHTGDVTGATTLTIADDAVTAAMMEEIVSPGSATNASLTVDGKGRVTAFATPVELTTGTIFGFAGSAIPSGWLLCDGAAVSRATYSDLFDVVGVVFGVGDGTTTFNLPDLRGRIVEGFNSAGAIGSTKGAATVTLATAEIPAHTHSYNLQDIIIRQGTLFGVLPDYISPSGSTTNATGGATAHANVQPTIILNQIIKI